MPRAGDIQLLILAMAVGAFTGWVAVRVSRRRRVGALAVAGALLLAWLIDRWRIEAVPDDLVDGLRPWLAGAAVAVGAGWGTSRLPVAPTAGLPPVLPLALASLVGVWAGVPETSPALLAAGVIAGLAATLLLASSQVTPRAAVVIGVAPVFAAVAGAAGESHAVVGGLLCSATLVVMGGGRVIRTVPVWGLAVATALQVAGAAVAARHVGIVRDWEGAALPIALVTGLAIAAAAVLHVGQGRPTS